MFPLPIKNHKITNLFSTVLKKELNNYYLVTPVEKVPVRVELAPYKIIDFKINKKDQNKIKKQDSLILNLEKNIDILNYVSNHNSMRPKLVIGFAAETNDLNKNAISKLVQKRL